MSGVAWAAIKSAVQSWLRIGSGLPGDHVYWIGDGGPVASGQCITIQLMGIRRLGQDWQDRTLKVITFADLTVTVVLVDQFSSPSHGRLTGDGPVRLTTTGTLPTGYTSTKDYWVVKVNNGTFRLAESFQDAMQTVPIVLPVSDAGTGTHKLVATATTTRAGQEVSQANRGPRQLDLMIQCYGGKPTPDLESANPHLILDTAIASYRTDVARLLFKDAKLGMGRIEDTRVGDAVFGGVDRFEGNQVYEPRAIANVTLFTTSEILEDSTFIEIANVSQEV